MDLESIEFSKVLLLVHLSRPKGQLFRPLAAAAVTNRYKFQRAPTTFEEMQANPTTFMHGVFRDSAIEKLDVYSDGIIATAASNTDTLDTFLDDFMAWARADLDAVPSKHEPAQRKYESAVVVKLNVDRDRLFPWARAVTRQIGSAISGYGNPEPKFEFGTARLVPSAGGAGVAPFLLEPRAGRPPELGLYFSAAPLKTVDHLAVLQELERELTRKS